MNIAVLSLGSNMGDRLSNLEKAIALLAGLPASVSKKSGVYETAAWGNTNQPSFYNQVLEIKTDLDAFSLMEKILMIEKKMGRVRIMKWEPRIIDIDILFFNDGQINTPELTIPHPFLHERKFVLEPLNEILPEKMHPTLKKSVSQLRSGLNEDTSVVKLITIARA